MSAPADAVTVLRRVSAQVSNEDFVAFDRSVDAVSALIGVAESGKRNGDDQERRQWLAELDAAIARVRGAA